VVFEFEGYSDSEIEEYVKHYDESTLRFGGM
jgi:hypothetical protein